MQQLIRWGFAFFISAWVSGCAASTHLVEEPVDAMARKEKGLGAFLSTDLSVELHKVSDIEVEVFLRKIAQRLITQSEKLAQAPIATILFKDSHKDASSYSLPAVRLYLSTQLLKKIETEAELAAVLASHIGLLERGIVLNRFQEKLSQAGFSELSSQSWTERDLRRIFPGRIEFFGPSGLLNVTADEKIEALKRAVHILYGAGYDPRAVFAIQEKFEWVRRQHLPSLREEINTYPPLRNPVVRSDEFVRLLKRVEKL